MTLAEFLSSNGLSHSAFAEQIAVSQVAVTRYALGRRVPRPEVITRIREATGGQVTANDFMPPASGEAA